MTSEELKRRTKQFALRVMKLEEANELTALFTAAAKTSRLANQQSKIENRK